MSSEDIDSFIEKTMQRNRMLASRGKYDNRKSPDNTNTCYTISDKDTDCVDGNHSDKQRTFGIGYNGGRSPPISDDELKKYYITKEEDIKCNGSLKVCLSADQPLDFSRKAISSDKKQSPQKLRQSAMFVNLPPTTSLPAQGNIRNNSHFEDDSCDDEKMDSPAQVMRLPKNVFPKRSHRKDIYDGVDKRKSSTNGPYSQSARIGKYSKIKTPNSSGSEGEYNSGYSEHTGSFDSEDSHSQFRTSFGEDISAEGKRPQYAKSEVVNGQSTNGYANVPDKIEGFHIQGILGLNNKSTLDKEPSETVGQINNAVTQRKTSPQPNYNNFGEEDNISPRSTSTFNLDSSNAPRLISNGPFRIVHPGFASSSHSINFPPERISPGYYMNGPPSGANGRLHESSGIYPPMQTVFPPNHIGNFVNFNSPEASRYSSLYSHPPGMLQQPFSPSYAPTYQLASLVGQDQQRAKKQRPFKTIDTSVLLKHLPVAALSSDSTSSPLAYNSPMLRTESSEQAIMGSSPQSPDSPCVANGSCSNEIMPQDINGECGRKRPRKIPPEEKDEKYREKRIKNNMAAKKSRDARRKKEDFLALTAQNLMSSQVRLETANKMLCEALEEKQQRLRSIRGLLIRYREKLEGPTKELFDEIFGSFLSLE